MRRGGSCLESSARLDYLVVGNLGQGQWKYSRYEAKIEDCINAVTAGKSNCMIVQESSLTRAIVLNELLKGEHDE